MNFVLKKILFHKYYLRIYDVIGVLIDQHWIFVTSIMESPICRERVNKYLMWYRRTSHKIAIKYLMSFNHTQIE